MTFQEENHPSLGASRSFRTGRFEPWVYHAHIPLAFQSACCHLPCVQGCVILARHGVVGLAQRANLLIRRGRKIVSIEITIVIIVFFGAQGRQCSNIVVVWLFMTLLCVMQSLHAEILVLLNNEHDCLQSHFYN